MSSPYNDLYNGLCVCVCVCVCPTSLQDEGFAVVPAAGVIADDVQSVGLQGATEQSTSGCVCVCVCVCVWA